MDFLREQETLSVLGWVVRALVAYGFLVLATRVAGQRLLSELRLLDFVVGITMGEVIAHPLSDEHLAMGGALITVSVLVILYTVATWLMLKSVTFRRFAHTAPIPLIRSGKVLRDGLTRARVPLDWLLTELRKQGVADVSDVAAALYEAGGTLSVFLQPLHRAVTPGDLNLAVQPFRLPVPVIQDGAIDRRALAETNRSEAWLLAQLNPKRPQDVLLATVDEVGSLTVTLRDGQ